LIAPTVCWQKKKDIDEELAKLSDYRKSWKEVVAEHKEVAMTDVSQGFTDVNSSLESTQEFDTIITDLVSSPAFGPQWLKEHRDSTDVKLYKFFDRDGADRFSSALNKALLDKYQGQFQDMVAQIIQQAGSQLSMCIQKIEEVNARIPESLRQYIRFEAPDVQSVKRALRDELQVSKLDVKVNVLEQVDELTTEGYVTRLLRVIRRGARKVETHWELSVESIRRECAVSASDSLENMVSNAKVKVNETFDGMLSAVTQSADDRATKVRSVMEVMAKGLKPELLSQAVEECRSYSASLREFKQIIKSCSQQHRQAMKTLGVHNPTFDPRLWGDANSSKVSAYREAPKFDRKKAMLLALAEVDTALSTSVNDVEECVNVLVVALGDHDTELRKTALDVALQYLREKYLTKDSMSILVKALLKEMRDSDSSSQEVAVRLGEVVKDKRYSNNVRELIVEEFKSVITEEGSLVSAALKCSIEAMLGETIANDLVELTKDIACEFMDKFLREHIGDTAAGAAKKIAKKAGQSALAVAEQKLSDTEEKGKQSVKGTGKEEACYYWFSFLGCGSSKEESSTAELVDVK